MAIEIQLRFYEELNDFIPRRHRKKTIFHTLPLASSVKDIIESFGVPHTEVDLILANGEAVDFSYLPADGDLVSVYPVFESFDISGLSSLHPKPLREARFILDVHLGKLAKLLRLYGFDTLYRNDFSDPDLIRTGLAEKRIILTRDVGILKQKKVTHGYFVRNQDPREQVREVIHRFDLEGSIKPFDRCMECNEKIDKVEKQEIEHLLLPRTRKYFNTFYRCRGCRKIYWEGSHYQSMRSKLPDDRRKE